MTNRKDRSSEPWNAAHLAELHRQSRKRRHAKRPCGGNTPATPTNLTFTWDTIEKTRGRRLAVLLGWDPVRTNTAGASSFMRRYIVQLQRSTDGGTTRSGRTRKFVVSETTVRKVTAASIVSGTTAEFTLDDTHDLDSGDTVIVSGMTPAGYNGTWTVLSAGLTAKKFRADIGSSPAAATVLGTAYEDTTTLEVRGIRKHVWYRFRVQAENTNRCRSDWSAWTSWTLANDHVAPPTPQNVTIFANSTNRVVVDWDAPMTYLPVEGTVAGSGTTTLTGTGTFFDAQVGIGTQIRIGAAGDVRTVTAIASDTSLTVDSAFSGSFSGAVCYTQEPDPDVAFYDVWIDTTVGYTPPAYKRDRFRHATKLAIRVADADSGLVFYGRVRSLDASGNRSKWVDATIAGNSIAEGAGGAPTPDGVTIGSGGGGVVATFRKIGRLRVKHYANARWTNTSGRTLTFKKARATVGDKDASTGAPTGSAVKINLRRWLADESAHAAVFTTGGLDDDDRLRIDAGTYKDVNGPSTFDITSLADDQALSVKIAQVGSGFPGEDLIVQVFME